MSATADRTLTGPRWSAARVCPRQAVLQGLDAPRDTLPPDDPRWDWWERGRIFGDLMADAEAKRLAAQGRRVRRELEVPMFGGRGTGHADIWIASERKIEECVTNDDANFDEGKALQAAGYALNHPRAEQASVIAIDPRTMRGQEYPIEIGHFEARVREIEQTVISGLETGELPPRVCSHPQDGPAMFCQHVGVCFEGWERPTPEAIVGFDDEALRLARTTDAISEHKRRIKALEEKQAAIREVLRPALPDREDVVTDSGIRLRRTVVEPGLSFSLADCLKAGKKLPDELAPFVNERASSERWIAKRIGGTT